MHATTTLIAASGLLAGAAFFAPAAQALPLHPAFDAQAVELVQQAHHRSWHRGGRGHHYGWFKPNRGKHKGWKKHKGWW